MLSHLSLALDLSGEHAVKVPVPAMCVQYCARPMYAMLEQLFIGA